MIVFPCPGCPEKLQVKEELAGTAVACPACGKIVPIPAVAAVPMSADQPAPTRPSTIEATSDGAGASGSRKDDYDFLAPPQGPGEIGRLGPYRVLKVLGAGGMGVVFQAEDPSLERPIALKAMKPALAASDSARKRFLREARTTASIKHDHIVTIHQVDQDRGVPFLAMEFLEGEALDERLRREGKLPVPEALRITREIAEGLAAAHERGLIHRDIKPGNIWLEKRHGETMNSGRVKILDFGLARAASDDARLTQSGAIVGTPAYMAPEQARGEEVDARCDLFSLGCVLYAMLTGQLPFKGTDTMSTLLALALETPKPPRQLDPAIPEHLSDFVMHLLEKDRAQRPASARAVIEALDRVSANRPAADSSKLRATVALPQRPPELDYEDVLPVESVQRTRRSRVYELPSASQAGGTYSGMGIASLTLGGGALLIAWIPCLGILSMPFSGMGLVMGAIAVVLAFNQDRRSLGFPLAGLAINILALLLAIFMTFFLGKLSGGPPPA